MNEVSFSIYSAISWLIMHNPQYHTFMKLCVWCVKCGVLGPSTGILEFVGFTLVDALLVLEVLAISGQSNGYLASGPTCVLAIQKRYLPPHLK